MAVTTGCRTDDTAWSRREAEAGVHVRSVDGSTTAPAQNDRTQFNMSNHISESQRRTIAGRARLLTERLDGETTADETTQDRLGPSPAAVLDDWEEQFASADQFHDRLERAEASRSACRRAVADRTLPDDVPLPEWVELLDALVGWLCSEQPDDQPLRLDDSEPDGEYDPKRPFGPLSAAVARFARTGLPDHVREVLSEAAVGSAAEWLRRQFQSYFVRILYVELKTFVAVHDRDLAFTDPDEFDELPREHYDQFLEHLFDGGVADFCVEYPMFARLVTTQLRQWRRQITEIARRVQRDREALAERFGDEAGTVTELELLTEDTHQDGRGVARLTFDSGLTVVYKPRSVEPLRTFYGVLDRLNEELPAPNFRVPLLLERDTYGWMEWITHESCPDAAAAERYYRRAGALVCLCYLLEFVDCQFENLVAAGEHPMLVDGETVCHPFVDTSRRPEAVGPDTPERTTVLLTSLLPFRSVDSYQGEANELSVGLSGIAVDDGAMPTPTVSVPKVKATNSDVMAVSEQASEIERERNVAMLNGEVADPDEHVDEIVAGFRETYRRVVELRDEERLATLGVPEAFTGVNRRLVYRPTMQYGRVLRSMNDRECMASGARFEVELEELAGSLYNGHSEDIPWSLYEAERRALVRLDPPRFVYDTDRQEVRSHDGATGVDIDAGGVERARQRIASADENDLQRQLELIRGCFNSSPSNVRSRQGFEETTPQPVDDDRLLTEAERLFETVLTAADRDIDGAYHWAGSATETDGDRYTVQSVGHDLYNGRLGIGVFGAALYYVTGDRRYREFALDTVRHTRAVVDPSRTAVTSTVITGEHGGYVGLGSVAYGLGVVGSLLDEPTVIDDAVACTEHVTDEFLAADDTYDIVGGLAGTALGFAGLYDRCSDDRVLDTARRCGDTLLDAKETYNGREMWDLCVFSDRPLTGFAHGAGGVAFALSRLGGLTGADRFADPVTDLVAYESDAYSETEGGWPDFRKDFPFYPDQWCHGSAGIGLSRLGIADYDDSQQIQLGIRRAVDSHAEPELAVTDNLCCGTAGQVEFCLEAAARGEGADGVARELVGGMLRRREQTGGYSLVPETVAVTEPTMFHGLSGIGYSMLRVVDPTLPSPLLLD